MIGKGDHYLQTNLDIFKAIISKVIFFSLKDIFFQVFYIQLILIKFDWANIFEFCHIGLNLNIALKVAILDVSCDNSVFVVWWVMYIPPTLCHIQVMWLVHIYKHWQYG